MSGNAIISAVVAALALGAAGCEATFTPIEATVGFSADVVVPVASVPADIWSYPRISYGGGWVYLVNGFWYQPTPQGWVMYRREPLELARERTRIYAAPRMPGVRTPQYGYPRQAPLQEPSELGRERTPQRP